MNLSQDEIKEIQTVRTNLRTSYNERNKLFEQYENIYFMKNTERPKDAAVDDNDWKITTSPSGRNKVTGVKQILDTSEVHVKVKGDTSDSNKIEAAYKTMLRVSGEYKPARVESDNNLASTMYGPVVQVAECLDDLIKVQSGKADSKSKFVLNQLNEIKKRTPFLISTINPKESFPLWGQYGMVGHLHEYSVKGAVLKDRWGVIAGVDDTKDYKVSDFFYYDKRLVEAENVKEPLFADTWLWEQKGQYQGVTSLPIFVRYAGGSTLFHKPEEQLQSLLYAYAKGEWDKRENLFWTYLFTAIYTQGMPGPVIVRDPEDTSDISVRYEGGVKIITAKGKLENIQVIDGDVIQLKNLVDNEVSQSTIQPQTIGGSSQADTFSGYVASVNAGKIVLNDPKEAIEKTHRDTAQHIFQRIKADAIDNTLIEPNEIPANLDLEVTYEPNLTQDDLRNSQIVTALLNSNADVSKEWINTNLLKISDSKAMVKQKTKEKLYDAMVETIIKDQQVLRPFIMQAMGIKPPPAAPTSGDASMNPATSPVPPDAGVPQGPGYEQLPKTDSMVPADQRQ